MPESRKEYVRQWRAQNPEKYAEQKQREKERRLGLRPRLNKHRQYIHHGRQDAEIKKSRKIDFNPLFDPDRHKWPEQDFTSNYFGDPPKGRREIVHGC